MNNKNRLYRIIVGSFIYATSFFVEFNNIYQTLLLFLIPYFIIGGDVVYKALRNIIRGKVLDENFLMFIATIGAFSIGDYEEAVGVMLFYQIGELFQSYAVDNSRKSIAALMDIRPDFANIKKGSDFIKVDPNDVKVNDETLKNIDTYLLNSDSSPDAKPIASKDISPSSSSTIGCSVVALSACLFKDLSGCSVD